MALFDVRSALVILIYSLNRLINLVIGVTKHLFNYHYPESFGRKNLFYVFDIASAVALSVHAGAKGAISGIM